jgi:hypothetical protein
MTAYTHTDGVWWDEAPLPRRWHRCKVQTTGVTERLEVVQRCACGAVRIYRSGETDRGPWMERNSRRKRS